MLRKTVSCESSGERSATTTVISGDAFLIVMPWQNLAIFSIRAESADIDNAEGSTSDTQPVTAGHSRQSP